MLEVKSLSVRCGALDIVKSVSFAVNDGEWLMIAGPNGAGKSTIINAVTGGVAYTGQILLNGQDIRKKKPVELAKNIGVLTLSGGELQRTFLAQVFAQDPKYLLLDEPTNHLDLIYQRQVFALIKEWLAQGNRAVISVVHDLSLAKKYGTRALLLDHGCMAAIGDTNTALNRDTLEKVYGMDVYAYMKEMLSQWQ